MRDEERYAITLEYILASDKVDSILKIRPKYQMEQIKKNRPGTPAADFEFVLEKGIRSTLYNLNTPFTLIYFHNPGCSDCARVKQVLGNSKTINRLLSYDKLTILALYPDDDLAAWEADGSRMPDHWLDARAASPELKAELYDLRATPSLYLLDKYKTVLLKDATPKRIEKMLRDRKSTRLNSSH